MPCNWLPGYSTEGLHTGNLIVSLIDLIRVGKQSVEQDYVAYMPEHVNHLQYTANMTPALGHDVSNDMSNFLILVQPIVSPQNGSVVGGEVLFRWRYHGTDYGADVEKYHFPCDAVVNQLTESCLDKQSDELRFYLKE